VAFIDGHRARFGVEPICRVLSEHGVPIAPSTCYAARRRAVSARATRDAAVLAEIRRVHADRALGRGVYGARKVFHQLARDGGVDARPVPRCQVERLMRADGLRGAVRGKAVRTTRADPSVTRPPDLVHRDFTARAVNLLWLVDFTYVSTWSTSSATRRSRTEWGWETFTAGPSQRPGSSWGQPDPGDAGAGGKQAPTTTRRVSTARWPGLG